MQWTRHHHNSLASTDSCTSSEVRVELSIQMLLSWEDYCETAKCFHNSSASRTKILLYSLLSNPIYLYHSPSLSSMIRSVFQCQCKHPLLQPTALPQHKNYLHVLAHHGNHEIEQTNGLDESETQNGVGEKLSTHAWVAGNSHQEGGEDHTDTDTSTTETNGGGTHSEVLRD